MDLELIPKIGPKAKKLLNKLNIFTINDLVSYYPYKYNIIRFIKVDEATDNEICYIKVTIASSPRVSYIKKNFNRMDFMGINNNHSFKVVIFNRAFLKKNLIIDKNIVLIGKYNKLKNTFIASDIKFNMEKERIEPIYHLTEGLKNSQIESMIKSALNEKYEIFDTIPEEFNEKYKFISKDEAIIKIHSPETIQDVKVSEIKLIYEELFTYMFKLNYLKLINNKNDGLKKEFDENIINDFLASLNFDLTKDQKSVISDILNDMKSTKRMNRLVLGDVGSGKTIVAIVAILATSLSGYQSSFMAPTELLAKQHFASLKEYFKDYGIEISLLTGSASKKEKNKIYEEVKNGKINVIVGTHSLLNEELQFNNLGLVITDEQHRFGVNQRNLLQNKGKEKADVLYLSATPIPRTYALTIYGDLDLSQIKTKPQIRKEVITKVLNEKNIKEVLYKMLEELKNNHQIFVVSPLIDDNDELDLNSVVSLKEKLSIAFNNKVSIEILHGKLKQKEKDELMKKFQDKEIKILISTTVIEVGIDIPNASMMVIFNAERFGLATLHQLRGRVGRSDIQSYCFLITKTLNNERLKVLEESTDGFYISEKDFEQRGQGDLFGVKQSGDMSFKIANIKRDFNILNQTNIDAKKYIEENGYKDNNYYQSLISQINFLD